MNKQAANDPSRRLAQGSKRAKCFEYAIESPCGKIDQNYSSKRYSKHQKPTIKKHV